MYTDESTRHGIPGLPSFGLETLWLDRFVSVETVGFVNYCRLKSDSFLAYARPYCVHVDGQRPAPGLVQDIYSRIHVAI